MSNNELEIKRTLRGFAVADFIDRNGQQCSIQDSSLVDPSVWLGVDIDRHGIEQTRMHLTQAQAAALIPLLTRFVETGSIAPAEATP